MSSSDAKHHNNASQVLQESIAGVRTVTSFNAKGRVVDLYKEKLAVPLKKGTQKGLITGIAFGFSQFILFATMGGTFYAGAFLLDRGLLNFDEMLTVFFAIFMAGNGLGQAAAMAPDISKGGKAASNVYKIIDRESSINPSDESGERNFEENNLHLHFNEVKFNYPSRPDAKVLTGLNLDIPTGSTVALVGSSGSGKSTIISLLQRFYDPNEGIVGVSGNLDLKDANIAAWRDQIGFVEQEPKLFATTIRDNITYGLPDGVEATEEMIVDAAVAANAHDFIWDFPDGYDTLVGDQGAQLSGGQKQRICIARAIIRKPKLLLLDEATSALDNQSEQIVQEALDKLLEETDMTTVVIAHRLTTIQNADLIVVMAHGQVIETGKHEELLELEGTYFKLWNSQQEEEH